MTATIVVLRTSAQPNADTLVARVHEMARDSSKIRWDHPPIKQRLDERSLNMRQLLEVLRKGVLASGPTKDQYGDWRIKLKRLVAGRRVQVVVAIKEDHFVVITAI